MAEILETLSYSSEWLKWEQEGWYSRQDVTILAGSGSARVLTSGMVLGQVAIGTASSAAAAGNAGDGVMGAVTVGAAKQGAYRLTIVEPAADAGAFTVEDPDGVTVGNGDVGTAFTGGGLSFTLADGATDFAAGDQFTITVAVGSLKYVQLDLAGTNGSQNAAGIILHDTTAPDGADKRAAIIARDAIVSDNGLVWPTGITADQIAAATLQLKALGILVREGA